MPFIDEDAMMMQCGTIIPAHVTLEYSVKSQLSIFQHTSSS